MTTLNRLYETLPAPMQSIALSARGMATARQRFGALHRETFDAMREQQWRRAAEWEELQRLQLGRLLAAIRTSVPFYRDALAGMDLGGALGNLLRQLPIMDKATLRAAPAKFTSPAAAGRGVVRFRTSGTSGSPMTIAANVDATIMAWSAMARFWSWAGVHRGDRRLSFTGNAVVPTSVTRPPYGRFDRANRRMMMSVYHLGTRTVDRYLDEIEAFRPAFIDGYPSAIQFCAARAIETGRVIRVPACFPTAETLTEDARGIIQRGFHTRVYNQYGSQEGAALITECPAGSLHVNPEVGIVEILRADGTPCEPGEAGDLVLTGLNNFVMPFIRYRIGDRATWPADAARCACGREMPVVADLAGRSDDVVVTPDGRRLGMLSFNVFKGARNVRASQIVQDAVDHIVLRIVPETGYDIADQAVIIAALRERVGAAMRIDLEICDDIARTSGGKLRAVISHLPPTA